MRFMNTMDNYSLTFGSFTVLLEVAMVEELFLGLLYFLQQHLMTLIELFTLQNSFLEVLESTIDEGILHHLGYGQFIILKWFLEQ